MIAIGIENTDHIVALADKMNEFFLKQCKKNMNLKTHDLYIACKYLAYIYGTHMGPKAVKLIEKNLTFVDVENIKGTS